MKTPVLTEEQAPRMRAWIEALRSGQYLQTRKKLRATNSGGKFYCCLGVAVEKAIEQGCPVHWERDTLIENVEPGKGLFPLDSSSLLIRPVVDWFGLNGEYAKIRVECRVLGHRDSTLCKESLLSDHDFATCQRMVSIEATALNDVYRWDFNQIADAVEAYYFPPVAETPATEATNAE